MLLKLKILFFYFAIYFSPVKSQEILVHNMQEMGAALNELNAGRTIVIANGVWKDAEILVKGNGTLEMPITLTVETQNKVSLEGESNLRIAGSQIVVKGLVFKNGHTPTEEVISFRRNKEDLCKNCKVTECVIDNLNGTERFEQDLWVGIYGKNNRFDHNYLTEKRNSGVAIALRLNTEENRANTRPNFY